MDTGQKIAELRTKKGWSQYRLSKESGVRQSHISALESGKKKSPTTDTLRKICDALGVSLAEFDDNTVEMIPSIPGKSSEFPNMENILSILDRVAVTENEKRAAAIIKAMSKDDQQASFLKVMEKFKSLSVENQEALIKLINDLPSSQK